MHVEELRSRHDHLQRFGTTDMRLQDDLAEQQRADLRRSIQSTRDQITWLREKVEHQSQLLKDGLITRQVLLSTKQQLQATRERVEQLQHEIKQIDIRLLALQNQRRQELLTSSMQISELEREISRLEDQHRLASEVTSPYTGRILELMAEAGSIVAQGRPIMRLDLVGDHIQDLEAVLYIPSGDGKKVKPGMDVQISPATVEREEHGFIEGTVTRTSDFPATPEGMTRVLKNHQLVQVLAGGGAPYETYASLKLDPKSMSGFRWSSSTGPDTRIQSGTICTASITVDEQRPAEMVLPVLKRFFGV
jgi:HlyD family secretion protein